MSGNYPDGVSQASFDHYWEDKLGDDTEEERIAAHNRQREWLSEVLQKPLLDITKASDGLNENLEALAQQVGRTCEEMDRLVKLKNDLAAALRECLEDYCLSCGFGKQGCAEVHHRDCRMLLLLQKAEGRQLQLNMEPEED